MELYTTRQVAERLGLSMRRVQKAAPGLAQKLGSNYVWTEDSIEVLQGRMGKRGNPNWIKKGTDE